MLARIVVPIFVLLGFSACDSAAEQEKGVLSEARLHVLSRGINTSHWFAQTGRSPSQFRQYIDRPDVELIREMGFRHIRLSVNPAVLFQPDYPGTLHTVNRRHLDDAITMILEEGLGVIVDPHPESDFKHRMRDDPEFFADAVKLWGAIAAHMSRRDPEKVFLEVMNEPEFGDAGQWQEAQGELLAVMRENAPNHTLIATGPQWSGLDQLVKITPIEDPNVVYNFHMYDPHNFTHQGASWGWEGWRPLRNLPYPSSPEAVEEIIEDIPPEGRSTARHYGQERWRREKLEAHIQSVIDWATRHDVHLTCNEFGVYRAYAPPESRAAFLSDVTSILEANDIGWSMWDYAGGFGVVNGNEPGSRTPDERTVRALGLQDE